MTTRTAAVARALWNAKADGYQEFFGGSHAATPDAWGTLRIPESALGVLGEVSDRDILDYGCGAGQWCIALARRGARPVGVDVSERQLDYARANMAAARVEFPLVQADGERIPLRDDAFDVVLSDGGAMTWCDPRRTLPEVARLLRPGGILALCATTAFAVAHWGDEDGLPGEKLQGPYFGWDRHYPDGAVRFALPHGEWVELFGQHGFSIEGLTELRPLPETDKSYPELLDWARKWPFEEVWLARLIR